MSEQLLINVLEHHLPWGLMIVNKEGKILSIEGSIEEFFYSWISKKISELKEMSSIWSVIEQLKNTPSKLSTLYLHIKNKYFKLIIIPYQENYDIFYRVFFIDITEFYKTEEDLKKRNRQLIILNAIVTTFIESQDLNPYKVVMEKILMLGEFDGGFIALKKNEKLVVLAKKGVTQLTRHINREWFLKLLHVQQTAMTIIEKEEILNYSAITKEGFKFFVIVPLVIKGSIEGCICLGKRVPMRAEFDLVTFLNFLGKNLSMLIERQVLFDETRRLSLTDPLTGLYNIRYFYDAIEREIKRATRYKEVFSVAIFDIDNFKTVNDRFGHQAGDEVLKELSQILNNQSRSADTVARYGGEEFILLLPKTDKTSAMQLAERIRETVQKTIFCKDTVSINGKTKGINITISGGIATFPKDGTTSKELLYKADMALYKAKTMGKARVIAK